MAKKDIDLYHSRLTQDDINDLIIKYKIPRDLYPWLPFEEFVMSELPDDAIGIYHWIFDFSSVRIPFSSFLLALIKHYRVHFSQLGPLGLNKKSGFFLIDWRAIANAMVWRHPDVAIDDPRPAVGSFNMDDVRRLSAHVVKLRDMPKVAMVPSSGNLGGRFIAPAAEGSNTRDSWGKGVMVDDAAAPSAGVSRPRPSSGLAPSFRDVSGEAIYTDFFPFFVFGLNDKLATSDASFPKSKAKGKERKKKIKSLTKSLDNLHFEVARLSAALNQNTILEAKRDGEILCAVFERRLSMHRTKNEFAIMPKKMVNFMHGSQDRLTLKPEKLVRPINVPTPREPRASPPIAKDLIVNAMVDGSIAELTNGAAYSNSGGVFMHGNSHVLDDVAGVTVVGSERVTSSLTDVVVVLSAGEKGRGAWDVSGKAIYTDFFPFFVGPYYATYPEDGVDVNCEFTREEWDALYRPIFGVLTKEVFRDPAICKGLVWKFLASDEFSRLQGELLSLATNAGFERRLSMHRTKNEFAIMPKKMISEHATEPLSVILQLKPEKLVRPINVLTPREPRASPPIVNAMVDGSNAELTNDAAYSKSGGVFMHGNSHVLDDVAGVTVVGSESVTSSLTDVVVVLSAGEKGEGRVVCQRTLVAPSLMQTDCICVAVHPADPKSCHPP
nr:hypothetical protein [Tanacetum cinerariifolium]